MDRVIRGLLQFPNPVNEKAARVVAAGVLVLSIVTLATGAYWLAAVLAYGFVARVLTGPRLSPLGQVATRLVAPRLGAPKPVAGPPKRFAQGIGAVMTIAVALVALVGHDHTVADVLLAGMIVASGYGGICWTDGHLQRGHPPIPTQLVLGHEGLGVIEGAGRGRSARRHRSTVAAGRHGDVGLLHPGGICPPCRLRREPTLCENRRIHGANRSASDGPALTARFDLASP